ncbi:MULTISPECIES: PEP-CTERM sorting domain-containing protein [unclassified Massilia]|uniref:PEP-CTERM sorting domain-containing protein n=1 Tax=unclassified Massilia TaxID=2609279 RepID=UPI00177EDB44|nr:MULTISPECIES: PEP-CTERM sorting domain-containing protein [unclassified Massilia]MBD8531043.1 PEP-CTERM sorting domain-containing protein [Massilia sp. CFBP 13647]MBD8674743.1 PEP-CTERM sorting domain-containing protein [Massilia sp. CFBP 13721]
MFKKIALLCTLFGCWIGSAAAAPVGWYTLDLTWRDGSFSGQMFYDNASPYRVLQVSGTLTDIAQTTAITDVWNVSHAEPADPWASFTNANGSDPDDYDAAFYLHLVDLGASLGVDTAMDNSLYDWSSDYAYYLPGQLDQSPLLSWTIAAAAGDVPEPASLGLLVAGLAAAGAARRKAARAALART